MKNELEKDSESLCQWVKMFANKTSHFVASWYRPSGSTREEFQLFRGQLDYLRTHHKGKNLPSVHDLENFNFKDIDVPDRLSVRLNDGPDIKLFILVGLGRSFFVCCLAHRGSTVGFLLLHCSSGVVRHPMDLQVSVATRFCRVLIFASSLYLSVIYLFHVMIH